MLTFFDFPSMIRISPVNDKKYCLYTVGFFLDCSQLINKSIHHHVSRPVPNICHLSDPPFFSLVQNGLSTVYLRINYSESKAGEHDCWKLYVYLQVWSLNFRLRREKFQVQREYHECYSPVQIREAAVARIQLHMPLSICPSTFCPELGKQQQQGYNYICHFHNVPQHFAPN